MLRKRCWKCKKRKPLVAFYKDATAKDKHTRQCKQCYLEYVKDSRDKRRETARRLYHRSEKVRQTVKRWHQNNKARKREKARLWLKTDNGKAYNRRCQLNRRASLFVCEVNDLTSLEVKDLLRKATQCTICRNPFDKAIQMRRSLDHILPLSRGGNNTTSNVQVAHRICNSRKRNKIPQKQVSGDVGCKN